MTKTGRVLSRTLICDKQHMTLQGEICKIPMVDLVPQKSIHTFKPAMDQLILSNHGQTWKIACLYIYELQDLERQ